jgi:hypothetical protein
MQNNNRFAGNYDFQENLRRAQMETEAKENESTAENVVQNPNPQPYDSESNEEKAQQFLQEKKSQYTRGSDLQEKGEDEADRSFADDLDPELAKQAQQGGDFGPKDLARYRELYDAKFNGDGGSSSSGESSGSGQGNEFLNDVKKGNDKMNGDYGSVNNNGPTYAQQAVNAAAKSNPVDFKALDQRTHDRPLYMQAQADIKHSEIFGDTWSWQSPPKWDGSRFKSEPMENRYADVMDKDDD